MVYVGRLEFSYRGMLMSHMASPDIDELHKMADKLGINRRHFQNKPRRPHYDISKGKKIKAIMLGACEVDDRDLMRACFPDLQTQNK